mgnify:CR=1 FL=1
MAQAQEENRRSPRRATWTPARILWLADGQSYTIRARVRDHSGDGCAVVTFAQLPAIGAVAIPALGLCERFRTVHSRRAGLVQITGLEFLATLPSD